MVKGNHSATQPLRGKNWTDEDTKIFISVVERYFPKLQGRCRKAKVFDQIATELRDTHGIVRTSKELQNKYKSIVREYRNALAQYARDKGSSPSNYKWFANLHPFMKHTILSHNELSMCFNAEMQDFAVALTEGQESANSSRASENFRRASPTVNCVGPPQDLHQLSVVTVEQCNNQRETTECAISLPIREAMQGTSLHNAENFLAGKRRFAGRDDENYGLNSSLCAWRQIKEELKEHTKVSTQVQMKICDSLENFNQMFQSLNGALSMIPNLFNQLIQCQVHQLSHIPQQNRQPSSVILSPLPQPGNQQFEQSSSTAQYVWLYDTSANIPGNKAALPGP